MNNLRRYDELKREAQMLKTTASKEEDKSLKRDMMKMSKMMLAQAKVIYEKIYIPGMNESVRETLEAKDPYDAGDAYKAAALKLHGKYAKTRHSNPDFPNIRHYLWTIYKTGKAPWNDLNDRIGKKKADKLRKELVDLT